MGENGIHWDVVCCCGFLNVLQSPNFRHLNRTLKSGQKTSELSNFFKHHCSTGNKLTKIQVVTQRAIFGDNVNLRNLNLSF